MFDPKAINTLLRWDSLDLEKLSTILILPRVYSRVILSTVAWLLP